MPNLEVNGASLYYETFGNGPLLLLIPGAQGKGTSFHSIAHILAAENKVVCCDRRGFSKSLLIGPQDFTNRLSTDADDAHRLIRHLSPNEPANVYGNSSGAIVALRLLERHPESVKRLIAHEPPTLDVLPDEVREPAKELLQKVYDTYRNGGPAPAVDLFISGIGEPGDADAFRKTLSFDRGDETRANTLFWLEFEMRQHAFAPVDLGLLAEQKDKLIPARGAESRGRATGPISIIGEAVGREVVRLPGAHIGYLTVPGKFAAALGQLVMT